MEKEPLIVDADEASAPVEEIVADVGVPRRSAVRETSRLYRLRSARFVALVAGMTMNVWNGIWLCAQMKSWSSSDFSSSFLAASV